MPSSYVTVAEIAAQTNIDTTKYNTKLTALIPIVSDMIDGYCKRPNGFEADATTSTRTYAGTGTAIQRIHETPSITLVEVKDSPTDSAYVSWASTDWIPFRGSSKRPNFEPVSPENPKPYTGIMVAINGNYSIFTSGIAETTLPGFRLPIDRPLVQFGIPTVRVTAKWGYATTVPNAVKQACLIELTRWFGRSEAGWTDTLASSDFQERRVTQDLDPATKMLLDKSGLRKPMGW